MKKLVYFCLFLCFCSCAKKEKQEIPVTTVRQGTFYMDIYEEGEIQATQSKYIISPDISWRYGNLKIINIIGDGQTVNVGDTVIIFDPTEVRKAIVDSEQNLEVQYAELEKMEAQQKSDMESALADLEVTKISLEISKIEYESSVYEADITKKEIQLNLEKAEISLEQAESQIENKKKIQHEEMVQKKLSIRQAESELKDAQTTLDRLFVTSPAPGIAILRKNYTTDLKYAEGDQVWSGQPMLELPNLNELKAEINVNEVDISKIKKGQKVIIRPDAFSDSTYYGQVLTVANLAVNKDNTSKIKVFPVDVLLTSKSDELMPGLTVSCRVIVDEIPNAVYIPISCLFQDGNKDVVYVKTVSGFRKQEVTTGINNTDYVIIEQGLEPGETISMVDPIALQQAAEKEKGEKK